MKTFNALSEEVTQKQLNDVEKFADRILAKFNVDIEFTRHFADRMNDDRNKPAVSVAELQQIFKKIARKKAKDIKQNPDSEAVIKDIQKDLNLPVVIRYNRNKEEFEVTTKTIMRKKDFKTSSKVITTEKTLTPAEIKKREEIAKAIEKDSPGMSMAKKMAIATATAKRVAEAKKMKDDPCWKDHEMVGTKTKNGKTVPNCVPKEDKGIDMPSESTKEYGKSQAAIARKRQQAAMRPGEMDKLKRLKDMLRNANNKVGVVKKESVDEALSPSYKNKYIGKDKASLQKTRNSFLSQIDDLIKFKKKTTKDSEVVKLQDLLKQVDHALKGVKESKKPVSQMTPAEKKADAERRKEYKAYQKSKRESIEEAVEDWTVTVTKPVNKLKKGAAQKVKARSAFEAINKAVKLWGDPALKAAPMNSFSVTKESVELEEKMKDKPYEKQIGMGDSRSEKEIRDQISGLSDGTLKKWASKPAGRFGSKIAKLQDKVIAAEMKKRGLKESVEEAKEPSLKSTDYPKGTSQSAQAFKDRFAKKKKVPALKSTDYPKGTSMSATAWKKKNEFVEAIMAKDAVEEARQMKDPKKDSMVTKSGKTIVIDKSKESEYLKKGWTLAENETVEESKNFFKFRESLNEKYQHYHTTFSNAVQTAEKQAEKQGYEVDQDDWFNKIATGPKKPSEGKTNSYIIKLWKNDKPTKKTLAIQVFNMGKKYELNMYIS